MIGNFIPFKLVCWDAHVGNGFFEFQYLNITVVHSYDFAYIFDYFTYFW